MARKRDPQQLLERARRMEQEARCIREQADQIRKEREATEDRKAGALLRRFWKCGWTGVDLQEVSTAADKVFGEPLVKQTVSDVSKDIGDTSNEGQGETDDAARNGPVKIPGGLFEAGARRTDGGG